MPRLGRAGASGTAQRALSGHRRACRTSTASPTDPGWALVGDAGYHKDPNTAQGITDAFRDAELLAEAIDAGLAGRQAARRRARRLRAEA